MTTARFGSRTAFGRAREEGRGLTREVRLVLVVGRGLCRRPQAERRERERPISGFGDQNVRRKTDYYCRYR